MTQDEILGALRALQLHLSTSEVTNLIRQQPLDVREQFVDETLGLSVTVSRLETLQFEEIRSELEANEQELRDGIRDVQRHIIDLADARALVDTLARVLSIVGRVVGLF